MCQPVTTPFCTRTHCVIKLPLHAFTSSDPDHLFHSQMNKNSMQSSATTTLFDELYRSTDQGRNTRSQKTKTGKKQNQNTMARMCLIDDWMEKKRINTKPLPRSDNELLYFSYSDASSHSSDSSSDNEYVRAMKIRDSCFPPIKKKHIQSPIPASKEMLLKSESRALKMYADLKKSKLPISPGGKLTSFINSMFTGRRRQRKAINVSSEVAVDDFKSPKSRTSYTCSSASSYTRSCLVKKSPSLSCDKTVKKSVRFYPINIEHSVEVSSRDAEHYSPSSIFERKDENLRVSSTEDVYNRASALVRDEDDDVDDSASDASSELFEIDHIIFAATGNGSHESELPVFETTNVNVSNRPISNGGILF
ncbi:unnamed protein product [Rhodiola kirilowii]